MFVAEAVADMSRAPTDDPNPQTLPTPTPPERRHGYVRGWDRVPLYYTVYGSGEPALVCCNGLGVSTFFWKYVVRYFSAEHRVVTWDYRGHNRSGSPARLSRESFSIGNNARDLAAVLAAAKVSRAVLLGHSMGCQVLLEFWRRHPERVAGLVPICGAYGRPIDSALGAPRIAHGLFDVLYAATISYPRLVERVLRPVLRSRLPFEIARLGMINSQLANFEDMQPYFEHLARIDLDVFFLMAAEMQSHDAGPWLNAIDAPTLVVAGEADLLTPISLAREMRDKVPGAELLTLPKGSHAGLIEHPELLNLRLEKFLRERVQPFLATHGAARRRRSALRSPGRTTKSRPASRRRHAS